MIKSLFISKDLVDVPELALFCREHSIELNAQSLITFQAVPFQIVNKSDCVFFSSPRAVEFFLSNIQLRKNQLIAVAGDATKRQVELYGYNVHFIPKNSGLTNESSTEFTEWLGAKTVLFPISNLSKKSYSNKLNPHQVEFITVYETIHLEKHVTECDCYIFTSPSNIDAYLKTNKIPKNKTIITFGESTNARILEEGINNCIMLEKSSTAAIIETLKVL